MELRDRTVIVPGASRGIGAAVAIAAAAKGARVGLIARSAGDLDAVLARVGERGPSPVADVGDAAALSGAIDALERELGPVDGLGANAGIGAYGPFADIDSDEGERLVQ